MGPAVWRRSPARGVAPQMVKCRTNRPAMIANQMVLRSGLFAFESILAFRPAGLEPAWQRAPGRR